MPEDIYYLFYTLVYVLMIPVLLFTLWAQFNVKRTFNKYSKTMVGLTGFAAARQILDSNGLHHVKIEHISGELTDHYDPKANVIRLSDAVYNANTAAAVGVAAHEAGHAVQYAVGYSPIKLRMKIIPVCNFGSKLAMPLFLIGVILSSLSEIGGFFGYYLMIGGIILYSAVTFFQLVTLPVEFNASNRAMEALAKSSYMGKGELASSRKVLTAAAMTYVAALASSLISLLRLIVIAMGSSSRRRR